MRRRAFLSSTLASTLAASLAAGLPRPARAATGDRKFLFVYNLGGWDPTRVYAPAFANPNVDMESDAGESAAGGIPYVDHADRPSVRTFFDRWHDRSVVLNGLLVRAISHDLCRMIALTGSTSGFAPDWPALIAAASTEDYVLPHLVIAGPSYPGDYGSYVARTGLNGQLDGLLSGNLMEGADIPAEDPSRSMEAAMDRFLTARAAARRASALAGPDFALSDAFSIGTAKAQTLKALRESLDFDAGEELEEQADLAVRALSVGLSRCVSLGWPAGGQDGTWDSHTDNDLTQSTLFEQLYAGLDDLLDRLATTSGPLGAPLLEETTVVVWSEMGRTPQLNDTAGKDHWPYTSVLLVGAGLEGSRVVGRFDDGFAGVPVDPTTGEESASGDVLSAEMLGATLMLAAGLDPAELVPGVNPLAGILR